MLFSKEKILTDLTNLLTNSNNTNDLQTLGEMYAYYLGKSDPIHTYTYTGQQAVDNGASDPVFEFTES